MADLKQTEAALRDFMSAYVICAISPDQRDEISVLHTRKQWAEKLLRNKRVQDIVMDAATKVQAK